ncbi:MAG: DUF4337 domain-containing protein [Mariniphaga sp.]
MAEEKKERWTTYLAISTVIIVVCATLSTFKGGGYSTRSLMNQTSASDQWAFYQSKSLKSLIFEMQKENLQLQLELATKSNSAKDVIPEYNDKLASCIKKIHQYDLEKEEITKVAKKFEADRDECKLHGSAFGIAVIFLQISILLSSISALTKKKIVWFLSILVGIVGIFYFMDGFFLFIK